MKPTLLQIAESYPEMTINVKLSDLLEAFKTIADEIYMTRMQEVEEQKKDVLITREEALKQLRVSETTLWRWGKEGYLCPVMHGARVKYYQSDIDKLNQRRGGY